MVAPLRGAASAFRLDIAGRPHGDPFGARDGAWLAIASLVQHAALLPIDDAASLIAEAQRHAHELLGNNALGRGSPLDAPGSPVSPVLPFRLVAEQAEDAGAYHLAASILAGLSAMPDVEPLDSGRIKAQAARIAWKTGDVSRAAALYKEVERHGRELASAELLVRGWVGHAIVAQLRGNLPDLLRWAKRALVKARAEGLTRLEALARMTLLVAAAKSGDFDNALRHGWESYKAVAGDVEEESSVLVSLGQLLFDSGHAEGARAAFSALFVRTRSPRHILPAVGGFALASAQLGADRDVRWAANEAIRAVELRHPPYQTAQALVDCAAAMRVIGEMEMARELAERADAIAAAHGYHELAFQAASTRDTVDREVARTSTAATDVTSAIVRLRPERLPDHVVTALVTA